jgi:hypothetical protein
MSENTRYTNSWRHLTRLLTPGQVEHLEALDRDPAYANKPCVAVARGRRPPGSRIV